MSIYRVYNGAEFVGQHEFRNRSLLVAHLGRDDFTIRQVINGDEIIAKANPNRLGEIRIVKEVATGRFFVYNDIHNEWGDDDPADFSTEEEGMAYFHAQVEDAAKIPNWEAQAEYDEEHGTINGEDPRIVAYREQFPYGE